ncbi:MAG: ABC transporter ATP-binding protein [Pseudomonadota bacterium]
MSHERDGEVALDLNGLGYRAPGGAALLADVTLHLHPGEILAVVGLNGAGKTTLIRLLAGLLTPTSGAIALHGRSYASLSAVERARRIAYVGQHDDADGRLLVSDYVALGTLPHRASLSAADVAARVAEALEQVNLSDLASARLETLSGGERQRAKFARAICQAPSLLLLDEPTNHLDPAARGVLLTAALELGITVVTALHDLTLIEAFATHVAVLRSGRLAAYGHPADILRPGTVKEIFGVSLFRLDHPHENRILPSLDIPIGGSSHHRT